MTVDTDQKYQEKVEAASNIIYQLKLIDHLNKGHGNMDKLMGGGWGVIMCLVLFRTARVEYV